jgi:hypothetical protein
VVRGALGRAWRLGSFRIKIERFFDFLRVSAIGMDEINQQFFASDAGSSGGGVGHSAFGEGLI